MIKISNRVINQISRRPKTDMANLKKIAFTNDAEYMELMNVFSSASDSNYTKFVFYHHFFDDIMEHTDQDKADELSQKASFSSMLLHQFPNSDPVFKIIKLSQDEIDSFKRLHAYNSPDVDADLHSHKPTLGFKLECFTWNGLNNYLQDKIDNDEIILVDKFE